MLKFDFNDILLTPALLSPIRSRKEINVYKNGMLPLITAPMDTVVDLSNITYFLQNKINVCLPRGIAENLQFPRFNTFSSYSLDEFKDKFTREREDVFNVFLPTHVLIDVANGHMSEILELIEKAKKIHGNKLYIMAGNIANPQTFLAYCRAGADGVRCGIGNGNGCLTTQQTAIGYPMGSLIKECYELREKEGYTTQIIADGGMKSYADIIKALALGADYVMVGSLLNQALESCGETRLFKWFKINPTGDKAKWLFNHKFKLIKKFRGMSTKEVQKSWGSTNLKTSEGVVRNRPVLYTLDKWTENFEAYLRSAMSYSGCKTLDDFIGEAYYTQITENAYQRFKK